MNTSVITIENFFLPAFAARVIKLNKRAAKLGVSPIQFKILKQYEIEVKDDFAANVKYKEMLDIEVSYETIKVGEFSFVGVIDHEFDIVKSAPGQEVPKQYYGAKSSCDHCKIDRYRKNTYIFTENNKFVQVGSTCLHDYFGINPAQKLQFANMIETELLESKEFEGGARETFTDSLKLIMAVAYSAIKLMGYVSKKAAYEDGSTSTAEFVSNVLYNQFGTQKDRKAIADYINDNNVNDIIPEIIAWAKEKFQNEDSEYAHNVLKLLSNSGIAPKYFGYVIAIIPMFEREKLNEQNAKKVFKNEFLGEVGKKLTTTVTVQDVRAVNSQFGTTYLVRMLEEATNNVLVWFASNPNSSIENGATLKIQGTVKSHEKFKDINQTMVTRVKIV